MGSVSTAEPKNRWQHKHILSLSANAIWLLLCNLVFFKHLTPTLLPSKPLTSDPTFHNQKGFQLHTNVFLSSQNIVQSYWYLKFIWILFFFLIVFYQIIHSFGVTMIEYNFSAPICLSFSQRFPFTDATQKQNLIFNFSYVTLTPHTRRTQTRAKSVFNSFHNSSPINSLKILSDFCFFALILGFE